MKMGQAPRILLIIPVSVYNGEIAIGPLYASSALKLAGMDVDVFFVNFLYLTPWRQNAYQLIFYELDLKMSDFSPQVVAFSAFATNFDFVTAASKHIKKNYNTPILLGGVHAIVEGVSLFEDGPFDAICVGEAEDSIADVVNELIDCRVQKQAYPDFLFRDCGATMPRKGYRSLDDYAFPDRECLSRHYGNGLLNEANFITGRGCPYNCDYCHAKLLNSNRGYLRHRSPENVIEEIIEVKKRYDIKRVVFSDESFTINKKNLFRTLELYRAKIALPFMCQTRVEVMTDDVAAELKASGCVQVTMGIESGSYRIRSEYLNRKMSNKRIVEAYARLRRNGIRTGAFNMIGLPDEKISDIVETIQLNKEARVDDVLCTILMPFKKTEVYRYYEDRNLILSPPSLNYYRNVTIRHPYLSKLALMMYSSNLPSLVVNSTSRSAMWLSPSCWLRLIYRFYLLPSAMSFFPWVLSLVLNRARYIRFKSFLARVLP